MGWVKQFKLTIDGDPNRYILHGNVGEYIVSGHVTFTLQHDVQVKRLKVKLRGQSKCSWTEGSYPHEQHRKSRDQLIEEKTTLIISEEASPAIILTTGEHSIPFTFDVKSRRVLPSSFKGTSGTISYELVGSMEHSGIVSAETARLPLVIWNPSTVNISTYMEPVKFDDERVDCYLCCASGPVVVHANINKTAMLLDAADVLDVTLTVDNFKTSPLISQVVIEQTAAFKFEGGTMRRTGQVFKMRGGEVGANTRKTRLQLQVGPLDNSICPTIDSTTNIFVTYAVVIKMKGSEINMSHPIFVIQKGSEIPPIEGAEASVEVTGSSSKIAIAHGDIHLHDYKRDSA